MNHPETSLVEWIRSAAIPLATVEPRHGHQDLEALRPIIGDARIVSLGEATHGTREFFKLKHRLLEFCVAELGFTMLGIEAHFPESLAVNAYVLGGAGNAADALAGLGYWIWDTEELLDLIEWMRWWNANNTRKVKFYGFVMASPTAAALGLIDFLARVAPETAAACKIELAPLTSGFTTALFGQLAEARRAAVFACIARVLAAFARHRPDWIAATSALDWHLGRLHATVLDGSARFAAGPDAAHHDRAMADNVRALLEAEGPDAKAVLWAHNSHVERAAGAGDEKSMGKHLDETFGRKQIVVGTSFERGSFQARDYPSGTLADHRVTAAVPDSFDGVLAQARLPLFALDVANAPRDGTVAAWLGSNMPMRSIGGIYGLPDGNKYGVTYAEPIRPREHLDIVMFVEETTAARANGPRLPGAAAVALPAPSNFELSGDGIPTHWQATGAGRRHAHAIRTSHEPSPSGGRTVCISRDKCPWRWGDGRLIQKISAQAWRGRRVRFTAALRTAADDVGAGALIFLTFLAKPLPDESDFYATKLAVAASAEQPVCSPQWTTIAVEADVPEAADSFIIGLVMMGNGAAWFGDLELTAIGDTD